MGLAMRRKIVAVAIVVFVGGIMAASVGVPVGLTHLWREHLATTDQRGE